MLKEERHRHIITQINLHQKVYTVELCREFGVSLDTVRRDLTELAGEGKLVKTHGGAISNSFHYPFQQVEVYAKDHKIEIAKKALSLIQNGMTILTGGGTVMLELAKLIPEDLEGTFFTVSPLVALEVSQRSRVEVILIAGKLLRDTYITVGSSVIRQLNEIRPDLCFLGCNGISINEGLTDPDYEVVQVKQQMIRSAKKTAILTISEKIGVVKNLTVCNLNEIDYLFTELKPGHPRLSKYKTVLKVK